MTSFGETADKNAFFTGKPMIDELGYSFLFRDYNPNQGKWTTSDPLGYPDGWNNLAYVNNGASFSIDILGTDVYIMVKDVAGIGHAVGIVGNPQTGYRVINYGGAGENVNDYNALPHLTLKDAVAYLENQNAYTYNLIQKFNTTRIQDNLIYETIKILAIDKDGNSTYDFPDNLALNCYSIIAIPLNDHSSEVVAAEINPPLLAFYANLTWPFNAIRLDMSLVKKGLQE
jgi:RHS repeat-associated protein